MNNAGVQQIGMSLKNHFMESKYLTIAAMFLVVYIASMYINNTACSTANPKVDKQGCLANRVFLWMSIIVSIMSVIFSFVLAK